jgi:hypothetical protein
MTMGTVRHRRQRLLRSLPGPSAAKEQVESLVRAATSAELLTTVWKALLPEEREMVRDLAAKLGEQLKNA